jgi:hypothetical protein
VAGFLPHSMARLLVREGDEVAYNQAQSLNYHSRQDIQVKEASRSTTVPVRRKNYFSLLLVTKLCRAFIPRN